MFPLKEWKQKCNSELAQSNKAAITQIATKLSLTKSYPGQTIDPIILHINFCEDRNIVSLKYPEKKSTQNSIIAIQHSSYYSVSHEGIITKSNPKQATNPIILHPKFCEHRWNTFPLKCLK